MLANWPGYWQKLEFGKRVVRPALPKAKGTEAEEIVIRGTATDSGAGEPDLYAEVRGLLEAEKLPKNRIHVPAILTDPHPMIAHTAQELSKSKPDEFQRVRPRGKGCLDIDVHPANVDRALRIMDSLVKGLEKRGYTVSASNGKTLETFVEIRGEKITFCLNEYIRQVPHRLTKAEEKRKSEGPAWLHRAPPFDYIPTGELYLQITGMPWISERIFRHRFCDTGLRKLEDHLNTFITGLIKASVAVIYCRNEAEERERRWAEEKRCQEERRRQQLIEEAKVRVFEEQVNNWHKSQRLREFIEAVQAKALAQQETGELGHAVTEWLEWATGQADRIDPLSNGWPWEVTIRPAIF